MFQISEADRKLSIECAKLCEIIYRHAVAKDESVDEVVKALEVAADEVEYLDIPECSTEAYLVRKGEVAYLAFHGSESNLDWSNNLNFELKSWPASNA